VAILTVNQLCLSLGGSQLLDNAMFTLEPRERVALIGRNGEGKSTFLKILAGEVKPDAGRVETPTGTDIAMLTQDLLPANDATVYDTVAMGLAHVGQLLADYHHAISDIDQMHKLDALQRQIEQADGWRLQSRIDKIIQTLGLPGDALMSTLSGGWRRRVAIAQVLVREPDVLLLDEPTNHLDLDTIMWLQQCLLNYPKSILFITHDRALLRALATRIIELDRGKLSSYPGDYEIYLSRKEKELEDEQKANALFDKKLSQEEVWIRQGIKARRTRNEGRVRSLEKLREVRKQRREQVRDPKFAIHSIGTESKLLIKAQNLGFSYPGEKPIFEGFTINVRVGDKIALIGPNGAGKTTLVNVLLGDLPPTMGTVKHSETNKIAVFDQHRVQIDPNKTVVENVVEGSDMIEVNGKLKHIVSYLNDFLFSPEKSRRKASMLSGGETNRLLLAKIFSKPANLLVLDEPTNDLDVESLEVLEMLLQQFEGTVIIISHDREFIDNVATHSVVFEGNGQLKTYVGGYSDVDWQKAAAPAPSLRGGASTSSLRGGASTSSLRGGVADEAIQEKTPPKKAAPAPAKKFVPKELTVLMNKIEKLETQIAGFHETMADPAFYQQDPAKIKTTTDQLAKHEAELAEAYKKFEDLS
jgi:ATP-binding cassette subfamily F protein uup